MFFDDFRWHFWVYYFTIVWTIEIVLQTNKGKTYNRREKNHINGHSKKHDCFLEDSFWNDIKSFMVITKGLILVSRTREQIAQNLCKEGPLILRSLLETDLLHLVDLLTLDKKRVEETPLKLHFQSHSACWEEIQFKSTLCFKQVEIIFFRHIMTVKLAEATGT